MMVTYYYFGKPFTQVAGNPAFSFLTSDCTRAMVSLDVTPGVAASGIAAAVWTITDTFAGSVVEIESSSPVISITENRFDVDASGEITDWNLSAQRPGLGQG